MPKADGLGVISGHMNDLLPYFQRCDTMQLVNEKIYIKYTENFRYCLGWLFVQSCSSYHLTLVNEVKISSYVLVPSELLVNSSATDLFAA